MAVENVKLDATLEVLFDEGYRPAEGAVHVVKVEADGSESKVHGTEIFNVDDERTVTLTPTALLEPACKYRLKVDATKVRHPEDVNGSRGLSMLDAALEFRTEALTTSASAMPKQSSTTSS